MLGEGGNNHINAEAGRDLIIGGLVADQIEAGPDDDILIPGTTTHDHNLSALLAIQAEWLSERDFEQRRNNLVDGAGAAERENADLFLDRKTVFDDNANNMLSTGGGKDWRVNFGPTGSNRVSKSLELIRR